MSNDATPTPSANDNAAVFDDIAKERQRQDAQWGGPAHDDEHSEDDWDRFLALRCGHQPHPSSFRVRMVKVAALAIAAIQSHDRKKGRATNPPRPGIYPITDQNGGRSCAMWDGECWRWWVAAFDPPEWDPVAASNCCVVEWRMP